MADSVVRRSLVYLIYYLVTVYRGTVGGADSVVSRSPVRLLCTVYWFRFCVLILVQLMGPTPLSVGRRFGYCVRFTGSGSVYAYIVMIRLRKKKVTVMIILGYTVSLVPVGCERSQ